jgi:hypothetical protein
MQFVVPRACRFSCRYPSSSFWQLSGMLFFLCRQTVAAAGTILKYKQKNAGRRILPLYICGRTGKMNLIPFPKSIRSRKGWCELARAGVKTAIDAVPGNGIVRTASLKIAASLGERGVRTVPAGDAVDTPVRLSFSSERSASEAYRLEIGRKGVAITGEGPRGVFYGAQTLVQLIKEHGTRLPFLEIEDAPDFPVRGFCHDVTRGKVPTLVTLKLLADKLASYKVNQLHLYIEHAFAFSAIPELWQGRDPLTAAEIRELDAYCRERCIDLVPTLATFGHLYELLRIRRFEHLNELDIRASELPHCLWDRMAHYTLDAANGESYLLIKSMIDEFVPLFSSSLCNICGDETFDLGRGKNRALAAEIGEGRLYVGFVKKIIAAVREHGRTPMLWGDVLLRHPELIGELPDDMVYLNWDYRAEATDGAVKTFAEAGVRQYVCPGVHGWSRFANDIDTASGNIRRMAEFGRRYGAAGMLNTDWGDCGHVNFLVSSFHGLALGAALSWNGSSYPEDRRFDAAVSALEWGDSTGRTAQSLRELGGLCFYHFGNMYAWVHGLSGKWDREREVREASSLLIERNHKRASGIANFFKAGKRKGTFRGDVRDLEEFIWSADAVRWSLSLLAFKKAKEYNQLNASKIYATKEKLLEDGAALAGEFERLWRTRNKESELRNVKETFAGMFARIERIGDG